MPGGQRRKPGRVFRSFMVQAADPAGRSALLTKQPGELLIRGPHLCAGYWNNPAASAAAIDADGWLHTGDLAICGEEG
ncbi:hypothetical protein [Candidatus Amarobacter glycogenicus]|uniref:hypothetical protein n=1 Tax=Candidatus Amarobacter glycogenicus TaxID=3140699 RepID=UPI0031CC5CC1